MTGVPAGPLAWFLDIDGVVSPIAPRIDLPGLYSGSGPMRVPYDPTVLKRIRLIADTYGVEICWLTTWEPELLADWAGVGLGPFPAYARTDGSGKRWKGLVVREWLAADEHRRAVWADDTAPRLTGMPADRLLRITPDTSEGLTTRDLDRTEEWLR